MEKRTNTRKDKNVDFIITVDVRDLHNKTISWFKEDLPKIQLAMKKAAGVMYDNSRMKYSYQGELFSLMFSQETGMKNSPNYATYSKRPGFKVVGQLANNILKFNVYTWSMWNSTGGTSIGGGTFMCDSDNHIPADVTKAITKAAKQAKAGIFHCSHCQRELKKEEIAGRYFAGVYCSECWERTYRAIEAKETYN